MSSISHCMRPSGADLASGQVKYVPASLQNVLHAARSSTPAGGALGLRPPLLPGAPQPAGSAGPMVLPWVCRCLSPSLMMLMYPNFMLFLSSSGPHSPGASSDIPGGRVQRAMSVTMFSRYFCRRQNSSPTAPHPQPPVSFFWLSNSWFG